MLSTPDSRPIGNLEVVVTLMRQANNDELPPDFSPNSLVRALSLEGDAPDGMHLHDRITGGRNDFLADLTMGGLMDNLGYFVRLANEGGANPSQERAVAALALVVAKHIKREGVIVGSEDDDTLCGEVVDTIGASTRPDLVPDELKTALGFTTGRKRAGSSERLARVRGLLGRRMFGG